VALRFAGDDFVTVPDSSKLEPADVTLDAWVRSSSPGAFRYVVSKGVIRCEAASYGLYTGAAGGLSFYISDGSQYTLSPDAGPGIWDGKWHHVAGTFGAWDGARVRLYVDGKQVGTGTPSPVRLRYGLPDGDELHIGTYRGTCGGPYGFVGDIDAVRLWGQALPAGDIAKLAAGI
jgi:hypothetical protein